jgi:hypothetical protein
MKHSHMPVSLSQTLHICDWTPSVKPIVMMQNLVMGALITVFPYIDYRSLSTPPSQPALQPFKQTKTILLIDIK